MNFKSIQEASDFLRKVASGAIERPKSFTGSRLFDTSIKTANDIIENAGKTKTRIGGLTSIENIPINDDKIKALLAAIGIGAISNNSQADIDKPKLEIPKQPEDTNILADELKQLKNPVSATLGTIGDYLTSAGEVEQDLKNKALLKLANTSLEKLGHGLSETSPQIFTDEGKQKRLISPEVGRAIADLATPGVLDIASAGGQKLATLTPFLAKVLKDAEKTKNVRYVLDNLVKSPTNLQELNSVHGVVDSLVGRLLLDKYNLPGKSLDELEDIAKHLTLPNQPKILLLKNPEDEANAYLQYGNTLFKNKNVNQGLKHPETTEKFRNYMLNAQKVATNPEYLGYHGSLGYNSGPHLVTQQAVKISPKMSPELGAGIIWHEAQGHGFGTANGLYGGMPYDKEGAKFFMENKQSPSFVLDRYTQGHFAGATNPYGNLESDFINNYLKTGDYDQAMKNILQIPKNKKPF